MALLFIYLWLVLHAITHVQNCEVCMNSYLSADAWPIRWRGGPNSFMNKHFRRADGRKASRPSGLAEKITKETNGLNRLIFIIASCISRLVTEKWGLKMDVSVTLTTLLYFVISVALMCCYWCWCCWLHTYYVVFICIMHNIFFLSKYSSFGDVQICKQNT